MPAALTCMLVLLISSSGNCKNYYTENENEERQTGRKISFEKQTF